MTCVVGLVNRQPLGTWQVWLGADSQGTGECNRSALTTPKLFRVGQFLIGYTSDFRFGQLVQHAFAPPALEDGQDLERYLVTSFMDALRNALKDGGYARKEKEQDGIENGGTLLVGVRGRLFTIQDNYAVLESQEPHDAIGCGRAYALGSLHATWGSGMVLTPKDRLERALKAAEAYDEHVGGPFDYEMIGGGS